MKCFFYIFLTILIFFPLFIYSSQRLPLDWFVNVNIVQFLTPFIQLISALIVVWFVNIKLSNKSKLKESFVERLNNYKSLLEDLKSLSDEYIEEKEKNQNLNLKFLESKIKQTLKRLSQRVYFFKEIELKYFKENFYLSSEMNSDLLNIKSNLTNDPFAQKAIYSSKQIRKINESFEIVFNKIDNAKLELYL